MKKFSLFCLSLLLGVFSVGNNIATIADVTDESNLQRGVISADLLAEMEVAAGPHPVCIWISDIDWNAVGDRISDERTSR